MARLSIQQITSQYRPYTYTRPTAYNTQYANYGGVVYQSGNAGWSPLPNPDKTTGIDLSNLFVDANGLVFERRETVKEDGTKIIEFVDMQGNVVAPVLPYKPFVEDREWFESKNCYTDGTDEYKIITFINRNDPTTQIVFYQNQTNGIMSTTQPTTWILCNGTTETPWGAMVATGITQTLPPNTISFTVTAQSGSFDVSFDWGTTYVLTNRKWSRTRWQGTIETMNIWQVLILSHGDVDVIRETI